LGFDKAATDCTSVAASSELDLLITFAIVLIAAEIGSLIFQSLRLPRVVGMLGAGALIGPNVNRYADALGIVPERVSDLAFLGGIFLMFNIGLQFNVRNFRRVGWRAPLLAGSGGIVSFLGGFAVALAFHQSLEVSLFVGLLVTPTSSLIALRLAHDQNLLATRGIDTTVAAIIWDDVTSLFIATIVLGYLGVGAGSNFTSIALGLMLLIILTIVVVLAAVQALPRALIIFERIGGQSPALLALSLAFLVSFVLTQIGLPPIFGAFWSGSIIASSRYGDRIQEFLKPINEVFSAVFFTAIGMLLDPFALGQSGALVLSIVAVGAIAKFASGFLSLRVFRTPFFPAMACATILIPRGEISLVIAQYAGDATLVAELQLIATTLMILTTLVAPLAFKLVRTAARRVEAAEDRRRATTPPQDG
jgi:monovalent cation:H+ antiporter-2, CPA2 family